jgi:hypothetical protein
LFTFIERFAMLISIATLVSLVVVAGSFIVTMRTIR